MLTGIRQLITRCQIRNRPPSRNQLPIHSQPRPPKSPHSGLLRISLIMRFCDSSVRIWSSGVALVIASQVCPSGGVPLKMMCSESASEMASAADHLGWQPAGHGDRERHQQQHIAGHGRVEGVEADAAEQLLGDARWRRPCPAPSATRAAAAAAPAPATRR